MGAATAWHLARRGADVVVHEQFEPITRAARATAARGSSASRIPSRSGCGSRPRRATAGPSSSGRAARVSSSCTASIEIASRVEHTSAAGLAAEGIEHSFLTPDEAASARASCCRRAGSRSTSRAADRCSPTTRGTCSSKGSTSVTARPWTTSTRSTRMSSSSPPARGVGRFFPDLPLKVTRETVAFFRQKTVPPSIVEIDEHRAHAMFSLHDPVYGLKVGAHHAGTETNPDDDRRAGLRARRADRCLGRRAAPERRSGTGRNAETCLYTTTPDERFILERRGRIVIGSACSGHGFKFAPAVGKRLADLALGLDRPT